MLNPTHLEELQYLVPVTLLQCMFLRSKSFGEQQAILDHQPSELNFEAGCINVIYSSIDSWHEIVVVIQCPDLINFNPVDISKLAKITEVWIVVGNHRIVQS
uniref:Uncharacterized protein n=1 Tax=Oryza glumipatula TaxID=40148 RepID=A0A0E0BKK2_9ORYZ